MATSVHLESNRRCRFSGAEFLYCVRYTAHVHDALLQGECIIPRRVGAAFWFDYVFNAIVHKLDIDLIVFLF